MGGFVESLKEHPALRWLLIWGGILLVLILAVHFFSKKTSGASGDTSSIPPAVTNISNKTVLNNGYPPTTGAGGAKPPTAPLPPSPTGGAKSTHIRAIHLPRPMTWTQIAETYAGGSRNTAFLLAWNDKPRAWASRTVAKDTVVNIPYQA